MAQRTVPLKATVTDTDMMIPVHWVCCTNSISITQWLLSAVKSSGQYSLVLFNYIWRAKGSRNIKQFWRFYSKIQEYIYKVSSNMKRFRNYCIVSGLVYNV